MENVYQVIMDHRISDGPLAKEYLAIKEGDLVEVLEIEGNNYYCVKFPSDEDEDGEEGFIPACCVRPLPFRITLNNRNSNNNIHEDRVHPSSVSEGPSSGDKGRGNLQEEWWEFCSRIDHFEPFPNCTSEQELANAKLDLLTRNYHGSKQMDTTDDGRNER